MNLTKTIPKSYRTTTTKRYLLPQILKTTRSFPTRLALRYCALISWGPFQRAFFASVYQARNACSESLPSGRSQNSLNLLTEITLTGGIMTYTSHNGNIYFPLVIY